MLQLSVTLALWSFLNEETMREFTKLAKTVPVQVNGVNTKVGVAPARTKFFLARDWALKKQRRSLKLAIPPPLFLKTSVRL